jgi:hypothetical protein
MVVKAKIECTGPGYKDFKKDEERDLPDKLAKKLIDFGYAEKVKVARKSASEKAEAEQIADEAVVDSVERAAEGKK